MTDAPVPANGPSEAPAAAAAEPRIPGVYKDDDLVYVDPDARTVVGLVEWSKAGNPKSLVMKETEEEVEEDTKEEAKPDAKAGGKDRGKRKRVRRQRFYPWGTYRSMKRIYKIEGKVPRVENHSTLEEVMEKALKEPFWD